MRVAVNKVTEGRQTPWDSSSLTDDFRFFAGPGAVASTQPASLLPASKQPVLKRSVDEWRRELTGKPVEVANEIIVADGTEEAYEAFVGLFTQPPFSPEARLWLDRHRRMVAWNNAVIINTAAAYRGFLAQYPDSDLTATARKLEERLRNRPSPVATVAAVAGGTPNLTNASLAAPTCPCNAPALPLKKVDLPLKKVDDPPTKKRADPDRPKRASTTPPRRLRDDDEDVVVYQRPPPREYYEPAPGPSIGIGIGIGGGGMGGFGGGGGDRGGMGQGRRGGY